MNAWADGLNYYLSKHPEVKPRVIKHFEPWMALTFSEGSIGGDIEKVNRRRSCRRSTATTPALPAVRASDDRASTRSRRGSNGIAIAPSNTAEPPRAAAHQSAHVVLLPLRSCR